ncbi:hypothetical protein AAG570_002558 [Ranatra chinensis]|uniref:Uncharacterized protein n=1 Tax=Ranatra chinensis TaxID=642074 RepID=A0ABD0YQM1_9HEMI
MASKRRNMFYENKKQGPTEIEAGDVNCLSDMKTAVLVLVLVAFAAVQATVVDTKAARKLADGDFLKRQKYVLGLLFGIGHKHTFKNEYQDYDIVANSQYYNVSLIK